MLKESGSSQHATAAAVTAGSAAGASRRSSFGMPAVSASKATASSSSSLGTLIPMAAASAPGLGLRGTTSTRSLASTRSAAAAVSGSAKPSAAATSASTAAVTAASKGSAQTPITTASASASSSARSAIPPTGAAVTDSTSTSAPSDRKQLSARSNASTRRFQVVEKKVLASNHAASSLSYSVPAHDLQQSSTASSVRSSPIHFSSIASNIGDDRHTSASPMSARSLPQQPSRSMAPSTAYEYTESDSIADLGLRADQILASCAMVDLGLDLASSSTHSLQDAQPFKPLNQPVLEPTSRVHSPSRIANEILSDDPETIIASIRRRYGMDTGLSPSPPPSLQHQQLHRDQAMSHHDHSGTLLSSSTHISRLSWPQPQSAIGNRPSLLNDSAILQPSSSPNAAATTAVLSSVGSSHGSHRPPLWAWEPEAAAPSLAPVRSMPFSKALLTTTVPSSTASTPSRRAPWSKLVDVPEVPATPPVPVPQPPIPTLQPSLSHPPSPARLQSAAVFDDSLDEESDDQANPIQNRAISLDGIIERVVESVVRERLFPAQRPPPLQITDPIAVQTQPPPPSLPPALTAGTEKPTAVQPTVVASSGTTLAIASSPVSPMSMFPKRPVSRSPEMTLEQLEMDVVAAPVLVAQNPDVELVRTLEKQGEPQQPDAIDPPAAPAEAVQTVAETVPTSDQATDTADLGTVDAKQQTHAATQTDVGEATTRDAFVETDKPSLVAIGTQHEASGVDTAIQVDIDLQSRPWTRSVGIDPIVFADEPSRLSDQRWHSGHKRSSTDGDGERLLQQTIDCYLDHHHEQDTYSRHETRITDDADHLIFPLVNDALAQHLMHQIQQLRIDIELSMSGWRAVNTA
ncbi:hypothetical protein BC831DRAFT_455320 [Entophlyctis helioformis]|nr:hypothetical protein BC831DRAFT_455320 [Entophlyctis helioformis]